MTELSFQAAAFGALRRADANFEPGRHLVVGNEPEALAAIVQLAGGFAAPARGRVLVAGNEPSRTPATRRKLSALCASEPAPSASCMAEAVTIALRQRGGAIDALALLRHFGLSALAELSPERASPRERRSVALALALAHDTAELLVLYEPLTTSIAQDRVLSALDAHALRGTLVVNLTASGADALALGGRCSFVELGSLRPTDRELPRLGPGPWQELRVTAADAGALADILGAGEYAVTASVIGPNQLRVIGETLEGTSHAVIRAARARGIEIISLEPAAAPIEALLSARSGAARGAYEGARAAAYRVHAGGQAPPLTGSS